MKVTNFLTEAKEIQNDLATIRRHIHQEPEIGLDLPKTQAKIVAALDGLGLEVSTGKSQSSVTAILRAGNSQKTVLLRADMDALPVTELADLSYKSQIDGVMHACGHGSQPHTAKDPIPVATEMVSALQLMITRSFDAFDPVVITVGQFHAGPRQI